MSKTIKLLSPIQLADRLLEEVTIRRMSVGDLIECPVSSGDSILTEVKLFARLSSLKEDDIRRMDFYDYGRCQDVMLRFRDGPPDTATDNEADASDS